MARRRKKNTGKAASGAIAAIVIGVAAVLAAVVFRLPARIAGLFGGASTGGVGAASADVPVEIGRPGDLSNAGILASIIGVPDGEAIAVVQGAPASPNVVDRITEFVTEGEDGRHIGDHLLGVIGVALGG